MTNSGSDQPPDAPKGKPRASGWHDTPTWTKLVVVAFAAAVVLVIIIGIAHHLSSPSGFNNPATLAKSLKRSVKANQGTNYYNDKVSCIPASAPHQFDCQIVVSASGYTVNQQSVSITVSPDGKTWQETP